ncbi:hypothetical protein, partial [Streptomyces sp. NPDC002922]|uniref:hypothetical protein n=1 Tax=Streptomyces sp. NPDC002922 TaxID=3154439 RepID=UPI0033B3DB3F
MPDNSAGTTACTTTARPPAPTTGTTADGTAGVLEEHQVVGRGELRVELVVDLGLAGGADL